MQIALPDFESHAPWILDREDKFSDQEFLAFCDANPDLRVERTAHGEIVIVPPAGMTSDYQSLEVGAELRAWARKDGRGRAAGSSAAFTLPDGSTLSPDAAWVSNQRLSHVANEDRLRFPRLTPEFIVEVMSPSDSLAAAKKKMRSWIANGVELAWLIDGRSRSIYVYKSGADPQHLVDLMSIAGEGPVAGFVLELGDIWRGL